MCHRTQLRHATFLLVSMPFILCVLLFVASCGSNAPNQANTAPDPKPINDVRDRYLMAFNSGDAAGVAALYTDDGVTLPDQHPAVQGKSAIQQYLQNMFSQTTQRLTLTAPNLKINGNVAYETGSYSMVVLPKSVGAKPVTQNGKYLVVLLKQPDNSWKIYTDIDNTNAPMQPFTSATKKPTVKNTQRKTPRTSKPARAKAATKKRA
jgi:uncharacterized protein (TIGR02246 family)